MQGAYKKEAKGKEILKMYNVGRCKRRTVVDGPVKYICMNSSYRRQWKFAEIRGYI